MCACVRADTLVQLRYGEHPYPGEVDNDEADEAVAAGPRSRAAQLTSALLYGAVAVGVALVAYKIVTTRDALDE